MLSLTAVLASLPPASLAETDLARFIAQALGRRQRSELMGLASLFYEEPLRGYPHSLGAILGAFCEVLLEDQRDPQHLDTRTCDVMLGSPAFLERLGRRVELRRQRLRPGTLIHGELRSVLGMRLVMLAGIGRELMLVHPVELAQVPDARFTMPQGVVLARPADVNEAERIRYYWNQLEEALGFEHPAAPLWEARFFAVVRRENHDVETLRQGLAPLHPELRRKLWDTVIAHLRDQELPEQHRPGRRGVDVRLSALGLDADRPWVQPLVSLAESVYRSAGMDPNVAVGRCPCTPEDFARWSQWDDVPVAQRQRLLAFEPAELEVWLAKLSEEEAGRADGLVPELLRRPLTSLRDTCLALRWQRSQGALMGLDPLQLAEARALAGEDRAGMIARLHELTEQAKRELAPSQAPTEVPLSQHAPSTPALAVVLPSSPFGAEAPAKVVEAPPSHEPIPTPTSRLRSPFEEESPAAVPPPRVPAWGEQAPPWEAAPPERADKLSKPVAPRTDRRPSLLDELPDRPMTRTKGRPLTISETLEQVIAKPQPTPPDLGSGPAVAPPRFQLPPMPEVPPMRATPRVRTRTDLPPMPPAQSLPEGNSWGTPGPRRVPSSLLTPPRRRLNTKSNQGLEAALAAAETAQSQSETSSKLSSGDTLTQHLSHTSVTLHADTQAGLTEVELTHLEAEVVQTTFVLDGTPELKDALAALITDEDQEETAFVVHTPESTTAEAQTFEGPALEGAALEGETSTPSSQPVTHLAEVQALSAAVVSEAKPKGNEEVRSFAPPPKPEAKPLPKLSVPTPRVGGRQRPVTIPHLVTPTQANSFYESAFRELERLERDGLQRGSTPQLLEAVERISEETRELYDALGPSARSGDREFQNAQRRLEKVQAYVDRVLIMLAPGPGSAVEVAPEEAEKAPSGGGFLGRLFGRNKR